MKRELLRRFAFLSLGWLGLLSVSCAESNELTDSTVVGSSKSKAATSSLLWNGAASGGTGVFQALEFQDQNMVYNNDVSPSPNGSYIKAENDAAEGTVWHVRKAPLDRRAEARGATGVTVAVGNTYYVGFRFKLGQVITSGAGNYHTVFQWKAYGQPMTQNIPIDFIFQNGHMYLTYRAPNSSSSIDLFKTPAVNANTWYSVVIKVKVGNTTSSGNTQIYWGNDSTPETLLTGGTSYNCRTFDGTSINPKWGYYNGKTNDGHIYFSRLKIGTSYTDVKPY